MKTKTDPTKPIRTYNASETQSGETHICDRCGEKILAGDKHIKITGVDGGHFYRSRHHLKCGEQS